MKLKLLSEAFSVCKVRAFSEVNLEEKFVFISKTDEELSLVCLTETVPNNVLKRDDSWRAIRIQGELDFSLVGILAKISTILANHKIGIFAISTYNTDYILIKEQNCIAAVQALTANGYEVDYR